MSINLDSIPAPIKKDNNITPFIARALELHSVHPVVSYYCKVYVLEYILSNRLHTTDKEIEAFTIALLEDTELIKNSLDDEDLHKILNNRQLSLNVVFAFVFKLFLSSLEDISNYDGSNKIQLAGKLRAAINFMTSLKVFTGEGDESLDFSETTGGKCESKGEFVAFIKDKTKVLKYQLSRLIKNEIPLKGEDEELAKLEEKVDESTKPNENANEVVTSLINEDPALDIENCSSPQAYTPHDENPLHLPGAPKYEPGQDADDDDEVKLPGAPKFLPDDDLSQINKDSSIKVFTPNQRPHEHEETPTKPTNSRSASANLTRQHEPITKENLQTILNTGENITKVQKHAKFAISALNYEDIETAEKELLQGLEVLRLIKENKET